MITDTIQGLLDCIKTECDFVKETKIVVPGASLGQCTYPLLSGSIQPIRRTNEKWGNPVVPPVVPKRRVVQLQIALTQCAPNEPFSVSDIGGKRFNNNIELVDNRLYCCLTDGFSVQYKNGDDTIIKGYIVQMIPEDTDNVQVTTWTVEVEECLEDC